jgi:hypothetical protein
LSQTVILTFCLFLPSRRAAAVLCLSLLLGLLPLSLNTHVTPPSKAGLLLFAFYQFQLRFFRIVSKLTTFFGYLLLSTFPSSVLLCRAFLERIFTLQAFCSVQTQHQVDLSNLPSLHQQKHFVHLILSESQIPIEVQAKHLD